MYCLMFSFLRLTVHGYASYVTQLNQWPVPKGTASKINSISKTYRQM